MKRPNHTRFLITLVLMISLFAPISTFAFTDGKGHFKEGMKYEAAEQWDKAAEEFALALSSNPKNPEYHLHLTRALFNASQMFIKRGALAAKEKDYEGAYNAFRRAYAFDPTNELANSEMERMVRLQKAVLDGATDPAKGDPNTPGVKLVPTGYVQSAPAQQQLPQKLERLRDVPFPAGVDMQFIIKELARDLDLNVLFDTESRLEGRKVKIELKNVTSARALDYIFLQEGLFFQKVGPRTIIVANQTQRTKFQQLVLRTFYLSNASPKDVAKVVQTAIPAQPGRSQTIVLTDDSTNSITIRDTEENIRLIGKLIQSLDKDRAEVVMDVAIYEVNKTDLMQFGNQIGTASGTGTNLNNIGGVGFPLIRNGGSSTITQALGFSMPGALGIAFGLPTSQFAALQTRGNTKLVASTQIHAFNNEDSSARIGQRVPVRSATFQTGTINQQNNGGVVSDVINYEQVGLTLKFKPLVFPNQDVQVAMEIESKDVAGAQTLTPTFTERTIKGTARVQNNKTLLLASVAQGVETHGRSGLPLLGLIPVLGRLFSAPTRDNRQVDIVIAVTPRVIRAPAILPEDEIERPTGSLAVPTNSSLEAMIIDEDNQEMLAAARRVPNAPVVQLPDQAPQYVRTDATATKQTESPATTSVAAQTGPELKPIDNSVKTLQLTQTSDTSGSAAQPVEIKSDASDTKTNATNAVEMTFGVALPDMRAGEKIKIPVMLTGSGMLASAVVGLKFDDKAVAIRSVSYGDLFGLTANSAATPFLNQNGKMYVSLTSKDAVAANGVLAYIEVEALVNGKPVITFDRDVLNLLTADGKTVGLKLKD
jgi:general secretion pathway protein D